MKTKIIFSLLLVASNFLKPQDAFKNKTTVLNLGVGLRSYYGYRLFAQGYSSVPYLNASLDHSVYNLDKNFDLGIGGYLGYTSWSYKYNGFYYTKNGVYRSGFVKQTWSIFHFGFRPSVHYSFSGAPFDLYAGLHIGYGISSYSSSDPDYDYTGINYSRLYWALFAGGRYYFGKKFGMFAELGYGISMLNLGISLKF